MTHRAKALFAGIALAAFAGCYTGSPVDTNLAGDDPNTDVNDTDSSANTDGGKKKSSATGLPCDVANLLGSSCLGCHGSKLSGGAPNHLVTYNDLAAKSADDPSKTVAAVCVARMKSGSRPMPPDGRLATSAVSVLERWVSAGLPRGTCNNTPPGSTPPPGTDPPPPGTPPPSYTPPGEEPPGPPPEPVSVCTSNVTEPSSTHGSKMAPGATCSNCHNDVVAGVIPFAGTVYPTLHEPDYCHGVLGVTVEITGADQSVHTYTTNSSGNFVSFDSIPTPYHARVIVNGQVREMHGAQTNGTCNACHTESGGSAPGRIMAP